MANLQLNRWQRNVSFSFSSNCLQVSATNQTYQLIEPSDPVNITASKAPKILDRAEILNYSEGTNGTLVCSIGSGELEDLTYEWLKDDKRIVSSQRYRISIAPENFNSILRVLDLRPDDSGTYSCVARNAFGKDKIAIKLSVKGE
jgi:hypothetical protein